MFLVFSGQFWNIPVTAQRYVGSVNEKYANSTDQQNLYNITVSPVTGGSRSFLGQWYDIAWDQRSGIYIIV